MLECPAGAGTGKVMIVDFSNILAEVILLQVKVSNLNDPVPSLVEHAHDRPVGICHKHKRGFKIEVNLGLSATRLKGDIIENGGRKRFIGEVIDAGVSNADGRVHIVHFFARVFSVIDGELAEFGDELPFPLIRESLVSACK